MKAGQRDIVEADFLFPDGKMKPQMTGRKCTSAT
jgi:hypothetical protein